MKFLNKDPNIGDIVRVVIKDDYYHYGIYIGSDMVIEFGTKRDVLSTLAKDIKVKESTVKEFLSGGNLEVASYTLLEKIKKNSPEKIVSNAKAKIGEGNYNLVSNNCEHFCYEVVFNRHYSTQEAKFLKKK